MPNQFHSIYAHDFLRVAVCVPELRVADPAFNTGKLIELARQASDGGAAGTPFPELCISAYSNEDLFHQDALLEASIDGVREVVRQSEDLFSVLIVGAPLRFDGKLFNCAVVIYRGEVLGLVPKS